MNNVDLQIENYTIAELMDIFSLDDNYTVDDVNNATTDYIKLYKKNKLEEHLKFILQARNILLVSLDHLSENSSVSTIKEEFTNTIDPDDVVERVNNNLSKRELIKKQDVNIHEQTNLLDDNNITNPYIVKEFDRNAITSHNLNTIRGNINPNLKNTVNVILNVDSQFRPDLFVSASNYNFELSEPLYKVVNYSLINFEIQHSWYIIDEAYGTDRFFLDASGASDFTVSIQHGNYPIDVLITNLNNAVLTTYGSQTIDFSYNQYTNKVTVTNNDTNDVNLIFYDISGTYTNYNTNAKINYNLGWILGFREPTYTISSSSSITTEGLVDLYGPKYLVLCIDDFNHNHINKGFISMAENITKMKLPDYFTPDLSLNDPNFKFDFNTSTWVPSDLTIAQAYTVQEIVAARQTTSANRHYGTSSSNVFGRIFLERRGANFGMVFNASSHLKQLQRTFYGPVNIKRMNISLYNDKGQLMNLNNQDYSFALTVEQLYQY